METIIRLLGIKAWGRGHAGFRAEAEAETTAGAVYPPETHPFMFVLCGAHWFLVHYFEVIHATALRPPLHKNETGCIRRIVSLAYSPFIYTRP